jgi:hypothetical protein
LNDKRAADRVLATAARAKDAGDYFYLVQVFLLYFFQKSTNRKDYLIERKTVCDTEKLRERRFATPRNLEQEKHPPEKKAESNTKPQKAQYYPQQ